MNREEKNNYVILRNDEIYVCLEKYYYIIFLLKYY